MTASDESRSTPKTGLHARKVHFTALYRRVAGFIYYPTVATILRGGVHDGDAMFIYKQ